MQAVNKFEAAVQNALHETLEVGLNDTLGVGEWLVDVDGVETRVKSEFVGGKLQLSFYQGEGPLEGRGEPVEKLILTRFHFEKS